ncbi:dihydropyrimidine dehydrogenase subunit A [Stieleria neptunia]|uniref:Dihydropyrimidine dehydrogenase subunit A n=1 Tax=Stieleria neptunia TaxID=2527979 RepID=A0A518I0N6_9BACT|nr:hypothetical protein [Stieleria neptunia]QDV46648.1 dihydropyrimidine dehydrogenase subunit A [Stieleria neptunia]
MMTETTATLEPPGSIAVIGAGPLGIEAALYGRFLGYDVTLFEAEAVAHSIATMRDEPIPMMPDRCVSPLARGALDAQAGDAVPQSLPLSIGEWIDRVWLPLTETDLLRGRLRCPVRVTAMDLVSAGAEDTVPAEAVAEEAVPEKAVPEEAEDDDDVPPDFQLTFEDGESADFEAVIVATGDGGQAIGRSFSLPADYLFTVGGQQTGDAEADFWGGLKAIVAVYASLGGRADLDLYQPRRG